MNYCLLNVNNMNKRDGERLLERYQTAEVKTIKLYTDLNVFSESN